MMFKSNSYSWHFGLASCRNGFVLTVSFWNTECRKLAFNGVSYEQVNTDYCKTSQALKSCEYLSLDMYMYLFILSCALADILGRFAQHLLVLDRKQTLTNILGRLLHHFTIRWGKKESEDVKSVKVRNKNG